MTSRLGNRFKDIRKGKGLSQKELADGICEQSQISKIERGGYMPSAYLLYQLAQRLEVPLDHFFNDSTPVQSNLDTFKKMAQKLLDSRNYKELDYLLSLEKNSKNQLTSDDHYYLSWLEAILLFCHYEKKEEGIQLLLDTSQKVDKNSITYPRVLNSLANCYSETGEVKKYESTYQMLIKIYKEKDFFIQDNLFGFIRLQYNYCHHLWQQEEHHLALQLALETIEICKEYRTSYQLALLLIMVGNTGRKFLPKEKIKHYYMEARELSKIYGDDWTVLKIEEELNKNFED